MICSKNTLLWSDRTFLMRGQGIEGCFCKTNNASVAGGGFLFFKTKKCWYLSGGLFISRKLYWNLHLSKRNPLFVGMNRSWLLLQPSYKQSLGFSPRVSWTTEAVYYNKRNPFYPRKKQNQMEFRNENNQLCSAFCVLWLRACFMGFSVLQEKMPRWY